MSLSRPSRFALLFLLLLMVAAAIYLYRNLDAILQRQVQQTLRNYGVEDYRLQEPRVRAGAFTATEIGLHGRYAGHDYEIALDDLAIHYDWRILLTRQAESVRVSALRVSAHAGTAAPPGNLPQASTSLDTSNFMPDELLARLPTRALDIDTLRLDYLAPGTPHIVATGHLRYGEELDASLQTSLSGSDLVLTASMGDGATPLLLGLAVGEKQAPVAVIDAQTQAAPWDSRDWSVVAEWQHGPLLHWLRRLADSTGRPLPVPELVIEGTGSLDARVRHPDTLEVGQAKLIQAVAAEASLGGTIEQLDYPGYVHELVSALDVSVSLDDGVLQIDAAPLQLSGKLPTALLSLPEDTARWLEWGERVPARWHSGAPLQFKLAGTSATVQVRESSLALGTDQSLVTVEQVQLASTLETGEPARLGLQLDARVDTRLRRQRLPPLVLRLQQQGTLERNRLDLELRAVEGDLDADLRGTLDLPRGQGEFQLGVHSGNLAGLSGELLPSLHKLGVIDADLVLEGGSFELATRLKTAGYAPEEWTQASQIRLADISGLYDEYRFDTLGLSAEWAGISEWQTRGPLAFSLARLNVGFDITDIQASATMPKKTPVAAPALVIDAFSANLFGGRVYLPDAGIWDFGAESNKLTMRAEQWQLSQIVALQQSEDIQAQGVLEGELPVSMASGRLMIDKGYLRALPPGGTIRYIANDAGRALGTSSKELALALSLLSDFRYEVLSSDVNLDESGNLLLGLSLGGRNPDQYEGRRVNFNINLEQNLDPLLQSLRLSGKLTEEIENRLQ